MTGLFSSTKKLLFEVNDKQLRTSILREIQDTKRGLTDKEIYKDTYVEEEDGKIFYFNRILNTAVYNCLIASGIFLSLPPDIQLSLANLYTRIKKRNHLIETVLPSYKAVPQVQPLTSIERGQTMPKGYMYRPSGNITPTNISELSIKQQIMASDQDIKLRISLLEIELA